MRLWLKVQARIWPATCLESLHQPLLGSKRAVVNAHQEMFWGWSIFTEIKVESTDVKQAIGVAISQWLHSSMCFVSEGNNSHKNMYSETCIKQKFWGDQMAWLYRWKYIKVPFQLTFQTIPSCFFFSFCLPPSSSIFSPIYAFFLFSRPLARLVISGGQNVSLLMSLQDFPAIVLNTLEAPLSDFFFVFLCKKFLAISDNFELKAFIFVRAVLSSVHP